MATFNVTLNGSWAIEADTEAEALEQAQAHFASVPEANTWWEVDEQAERPFGLPVLKPIDMTIQSIFVKNMNDLLKEDK